MNIKRRLVGLALSLGYAVVYGFLALMATGGGHANFIWLSVFFPVFFGVPYFLLIGFLASDLKPFWSKSFFVSLMILHYFFIGLQIFLLSPEFAEKTISDINRYWTTTLIMAAAYLFGQAVLWLRFAGAITAGQAYHKSDELQKYL